MCIENASLEAGQRDRCQAYFACILFRGVSRVFVLAYFECGTKTFQCMARDGEEGKGDSCVCTVNSAPGFSGVDTKQPQTRDQKKLKKTPFGEKCKTAYPPVTVGCGQGQG